MNVTVSDFTEAERELVADLLRERYSRPVSPELADSELKLDPASDDMTICPTLYWSERGAHFVVCKVGQDRYRCQFFYADADQYGTGHDEYIDLRRCVLTLLRVQADHEKQSAGVSSGATAVDLAAGPDDDEYPGLVVILERARQLLETQIGLGGGYNRQGERLILTEVAREHGPAAADGLIRERELERVFGIVPGTQFLTPAP